MSLASLTCKCEKYQCVTVIIINFSSTHNNSILPFTNFHIYFLSKIIFIICSSSYKTKTYNTNIIYTLYILPENNLQHLHIISMPPLKTYRSLHFIIMAWQLSIPPHSYHKNKTWILYCKQNQSSSPIPTINNIIIYLTHHLKESAHQSVRHCDWCPILWNEAFGMGQSITHFQSIRKPCMAQKILSIAF